MRAVRTTGVFGVVVAGAVALVLTMPGSALAAAGSPSARPAAAAPATAASPPSVRDIDRFVVEQQRALRLPAIEVVVLRGGRPYAELSHGQAAPGRPATLDTPFLLGSTSKQLTGLAVQQLVAAGRLSLETRVHTVLPGYGDGRDAKSRTTVRDLLGQTSGLSTATGLRQWGWRLGRPGSIAANAAAVGRADLDRPTGRSFEYSNSNYDVLGAVVEAVTGTSFAQAMHDLVVVPLGLSRTTADPALADGDGVAAGYYSWFGVLTLPTGSAAAPGAVPSARVTSTARDLTRLLRAHLGTVDSGVATAARAPLSRASEYAAYASGWYDRPLWEAHARNADWQDPSLPQCAEHDGQTARSMSYLMVCPATGFGIVALANAGPGPDDGRWSRFTDGLVHAALGTSPPSYWRDVVTGHAGAVMLVTLVAQVAALTALVRVVRRRRPRRHARSTWTVAVASGAVSLAALWLVWVFAPHRGGQGAPLGAVWDAAPTWPSRRSSSRPSPP